MLCHVSQWPFDLAFLEKNQKPCQIQMEKMPSPKFVPPTDARSTNILRPPSPRHEPGEGTAEQVLKGNGCKVIG